MSASIIVAIISGLAVAAVPTITYALTKKKERDADWRKYKFEHYREFALSLSGIVGSDSSPEGNRRFARACNTLHLIASAKVLNALHEFQDEIFAFQILSAQRAAMIYC